jgi:hypothetical protein
LHENIPEFIDKSNIKRVINLTTNKEFDSIVDAAKYYNLIETAISYVCKGKRKTHGGFRWKYI